MKLKDFKNKIRRGLGSAIIVLKSEDDISKYRDIVLWACLKNTCYDHQIEDSRAGYLYEAICCYEDRQYFESKIIDKFLKVNDDLDHEQLMKILFYFAGDGSKIAANALYDMFDLYIAYLLKDGDFKRRRLHIDRFEALIIHICILHGFRSYKKIITEIGKVVLNKNAAKIFTLDWFYSFSKDHFGEKRLTDYLEKQSRTSSHVKAFYEMLKNEDENKTNIEENSTQNNMTTDNFLNLPDDDSVESNWNRIKFSRKLAINMTGEEKTALANRIVNETDIRKKSAMLEIFEETDFPLSIDILIGYINSNDKLLREPAFCAIQRFKNKKVHDLAVSLLNANKDIRIAFDLLENNYQHDDELIYTAIKKLDKKNLMDFHHIGISIRTIYEKNNSKNNFKTLIYLYNQAYCSFCRESFIKILHKNKLLPDAILNECIYDSDKNLRKFAKRILKKEYSHIKTNMDTPEYFSR